MMSLDDVAPILNRQKNSQPCFFSTCSFLVSLSAVVCWQAVAVDGFSSFRPTTGTTAHNSLNNQQDPNHFRPKFAILVDAENTQASKLGSIVEEVVALGGDATVRRVYGDLSDPQLVYWKKVSLECSFLPVNTFRYVSGKGTADSALIIDAMELLYTNPTIDAYALVSSDSDFTRLAQKIREMGKSVIGFGRRITPSKCRSCPAALLAEKKANPWGIVCGGEML